MERGEIRIATDPPFDFDAPPLPDGWIDSAAALAAAEKEAGSEFRRDHAGRVQALFLVRGVMDESRPGVATWAVVYSSESAPGLWVVVDAHDGKVKKQWRG